MEKIRIQFKNYILPTFNFSILLLHNNNNNNNNTICIYFLTLEVTLLDVYFCIICTFKTNKKQTPWPLVRERTIPTERRCFYIQMTCPSQYIAVFTQGIGLDTVQTEVRCPLPQTDLSCLAVDTMSTITTMIIKWIY
jgi:hypothetical protein